MTVLKVTTVGNSVGVILPKELLERLRVGKGDSLYVIETKQGIELTPYNPEFASQMEAARAGDARGPRRAPQARRVSRRLESSSFVGLRGLPTCP